MHMRPRGCFACCRKPRTHTDQKHMPSRTLVQFILIPPNRITSILSAASSPSHSSFKSFFVRLFNWNIGATFAVRSLFERKHLWLTSACVIRFFRHINTKHVRTAFRWTSFFVHSPAIPRLTCHSSCRVEKYYKRKSSLRMFAGIRLLQRHENNIKSSPNCTHVLRPQIRMFRLSAVTLSSIPFCHWLNSWILLLSFDPLPFENSFRVQLLQFI